VIDFFPEFVKAINFNFGKQQPSTEIKGLILKHEVDVGYFNFDVCECFVQKLSG
jgi:hypothetical protein